MAYGLSRWGLSPWGLGEEEVEPPPPPVVETMWVRIVSERQIEVRFLHDILAISEIGNYDALNPASWYVSNTTTGELPVMAVSQTGTNTFVVYLLYKLGSNLIEHTINASVLDADGITDRSDSLAFWGCIAKEEAKASRGHYDFENFAFDTDRPAGTLSVESTGDYRLQTGSEFWRKMIIRRLSTLPGGFFHLSDFGIDLKLNETLRANDLVMLRTEIDRELMKEQRFEEVSSRVQLYVDGRLTIEVRVKLVTDQNISVAIEATR